MKTPRKPFTMNRIMPGDKTIEIYGPPNPRDPDGYFDVLCICVDYDDVNHPSIRRQARKLVAILNEHWAKPTPK